MIIWIPILLLALLILLCHSSGLIDLNSRPVTRIFKWSLIALWAWFLPLIIRRLFKLNIDAALLDLWKMLVIGFLLLWVVAAFLIWVWRHYGPVPAGCRHCPKCRIPVLKVMLECPHCKHSLDNKA